MSPLAWIACLSLCLAAFSRSETIEIRAIRTSEAIAFAIRTNLEDGVISTEHFETTYDRLVSERKIEEIARFAKPDATNDRIKFETTGPAERWRTAFEMHPQFTDDDCQLTFVANLQFPGKKVKGESPSFDCMSAASLDYGRWQILAEGASEEGRVLCLVKILKPGNPAAPARMLSLVAEGYLIPTTETEAANAVRLDAAGIDALLAKVISRKQPKEYFRYSLAPAQPGRTAKSHHPDHGFKVADPAFIHLDCEAHASPDAKWVYLQANATIDRADAMSRDLPVYGHTFRDTIPMGTWTVIPAQRHPSDGSSLLVLRITDRRKIAADGSDDEKPRPLPDSGTVTRTYPAIHPRIREELPPGMGPLSLKEILVANGIRDGGWNVIMIQNQIIISNADVSVHRQIEAFLKDHTWEVEIRKKTGVSR